MDITDNSSLSPAAGGWAIRGYLLVEALVFWGTVGFCYWLVPRENNFAFLSHSFSYLGGFDACHNPRWWWVFSIAMAFWGIATVPVVLYIYHRFAPISRWAARTGAIILLIGCLGIVLVGVIPTGHSTVPGGFDWILAHRRAGLLTATGFGVGVFWFEIMLFVDGFTRKRLGQHGYWRYVWPYAFWWTMIFLTTYYLVSWMFVYERMKTEAAAAGRALQGSWTEALNTRYSIPLWENIMIITLFVFLVWLPLALPREIPGEQEPRVR